MADFIVAIELGSSKMTGIAGRKNLDGSINVLAVVKEDSTDCIRKGIVYNIDKTAQALMTIVKKLENNLKTSFATLAKRKSRGRKRKPRKTEALTVTANSLISFRRLSICGRTRITARKERFRRLFAASSAFWFRTLPCSSGRFTDRRSSK